jgi:hypothetical protein
MIHDFQKSYIIEMDDYISTVLSQEDVDGMLYLVTYYSHQLLPTEINY